MLGASVTHAMSARIERALNGLFTGMGNSAHARRRVRHTLCPIRFARPARDCVETHAAAASPNGNDAA
jgi:hypothetical protein